jgi:DNA helicase-2/ATP-dependent DNA helicase PcrA
VERHLGKPQLLAEDELEWESLLSDNELKELKDAWLASDWSQKRPVEIELPFEIIIEGTLLRGRVDAVYESANGIEVVDWKTGIVKSGDDLESASIQLAAYRIAVSKVMNRPLETISAAFHYVKENVTIRPADLLDEAGIIRLLPKWVDDH